MEVCSPEFFGKEHTGDFFSLKEVPDPAGNYSVSLSGDVSDTPILYFNKALVCEFPDSLMGEHQRVFAQDNKLSICDWHYSMMGRASIIMLWELGHLIFYLGHIPTQAARYGCCASPLKTPGANSCL
jgi:hypothetical protein